MSERTITQWQEMMARGEITAVGLVQHYLGRIQQIDRDGPALNAVLELNPDAQAIAANLDKERAAGQPRGPLHGMPILIKGNIDTADRMTTTAGSLALAGHIAARDAFLVERLREAGAIILGKTNLSEWANFRSTRSSSGWSSQGGQTRNPYALDRNPCGSSSGSGVAAAADLCAAAVGTETDGSIVCPAHANGIVGIKPTVGLVSRAGIVPISHSQDTAGPMARTVSDAALLLAAMSGVDARDEATRPDAHGGGSIVPVPGTRFGPQDAAGALDVDGLRGARIGVARNLCGIDPQADAILETSLEVMRDAGATIVDEANVETAARLGEPELEVLHYEFKQGLNDYLASLDAQARIHSLAEVIAYNDAHAEVMMPYFGQEHFLAAQAKGPLTDPAYTRARAACLRLARAEGIDATLAAHNLDAIVAPTGAPPWLTDWINGDCYKGGTSSLAAVAGYPAVSVPAGYVFGLPVNITFFASAWQEAALLRLAYAFEQATQVRRPPQYLPSVDFNRPAA